MSDLTKYVSINRLINSISARRGGSISESTMKTFLHFIRRYCDFVGMSPDQIIEDRVMCLKSDDLFTRRKHEELVMKFAQALRSSGYSTNTIATAVGAIRSFYRSNYVPLVEVRVPSGVPVRQYKIPTKDELRVAVENAPRKWVRTFMILTKDCGMSLQDMLNLRMDSGSPIYGSIKQQLANGQIPIHVRIVREKTMHTYDTFLGEDSYYALTEYKRDGKLFPYTKQAIQMSMKRLGMRLGWENFTPYSLRKWFRTQLTLSGVNEAIIEYLMGHKLAKVRSAYFIPPPQKLMEIYVKHYDSLRLL